MLSPSDNSLITGAMRPWVPWVLGAGAAVAALAGAIILARLSGAISYRIGPKSVLITLFGVPVRRLGLDNIRHISSRRGGFCESWPNVLFPNRDRILVIEKRHGVLKRLMITPPQRYVFKAALDRAIREFNGLPENQRTWAAVTPGMAQPAGAAPAAGKQPDEEETPR
jgi:hypothetical protein